MVQGVQQGPVLVGTLFTPLCSCCYVDSSADLAKQRRKNSWGGLEVSKNDFCVYFFFWCVFFFVPTGEKSCGRQGSDRHQGTNTNGTQAGVQQRGRRVTTPDSSSGHGGGEDIEATGDGTKDGGGSAKEHSRGGGAS